MIGGAIFDVDGTLLDSMGIWEEAGARYLQRIGIMPEEALGRTLFPMTIEEAALYMKERYGLQQSPAAVEAGILDTVREFYFQEAPLKEGAAAFLEAMARKGVPMVVASSSEESHLEAAFRRLGIRQYFEKLLTCAQVGEGKSSPAIYLEAAAYLGAAPEDICVFEDALYALQTAKKAGFRTIGVYDVFSEGDWKTIEKKADLALADWRETHLFWRYVSM